jgi:hypothetical protein
MVPYVESMQNNNLLAHDHAQKGVTCLDCHDLTTLQYEHEVGDPNATSLPVVTMPTDVCLKCHGSYKQVIQLTAGLDRNPHDSHDGEVDCNICHKMHQPSQYYCAKCHPLSRSLGPEWAQ